jgi:hypothetical protein
MAQYATQGTQLQLEIATVFTNVPGVEALDGPGGDKEEIEVTAISDTVKKYLSGLRDEGEVSFGLFYDPANAVHAAIKSNYDASGNTVVNWKIILPDDGAAEIAFSGYVKTFRWNHQKNTAGMANVAIRVTGPAVVTP